MLIELMIIAAQTPPKGTIQIPISAVLAVPGTLCSVIAYLYISKEKLTDKMFTFVQTMTSDYNTAMTDAALAQNNTANSIEKLAIKLGTSNGV